MRSPRRGAVDDVATVPEQRYIDSLVADLEAALPLIWGRPIHSIFIGGGTPSLFSPQAIDRMLGDLRARLMLEPDCEITLEANPGTFEKDRFRAFRQAGVTRLSVGVQSFDDAHLQALGRVHDSAQAIAAVEEAALAFETFNLDLMYALPGQTHGGPGSGHGPGPGPDAASLVGVSPDDRAQHVFRQVPAARAGRGHGLCHAGPHHGDDGRRRHGPL